MKKSLPSYTKLSEALSQTALKLHPAQVHGLVSGFLCANPNSPAAWEELVTGGKEKAQTHEILQQLFDATANQLKDFLFDFKLLLPPDSKPLPVRAEALTLWCQGFLTGLKLAQVPIVDRDPGDVTEAINDFIEIAKMNYEEVIASEEDEAAYMELVEYVRMAVILVYQDLREQDTSKENVDLSTKLH